VDPFSVAAQKSPTSANRFHSTSQVKQKNHCVNTNNQFEIKKTKTGNNNASGQQIDQKSDQWFGATVRSAGPNGPVLVS
jgi:hypothetical protein